MEEKETGQEVDAFSARLRQCTKYAIFAGVLGFIAGGCFVGGYLMVSDKPQYANAMVAPLVTAAVGAGMVVGLTLLFSPAEVFSSPKGQESLKAIGVSSAAGARIVIVILLLLGSALIALLGLGALQMVGVID